MTVKHDDAIEWPNGEGFTPCSREYAELMDKRDALKPDWVNLDDLSPEDYQEWNVLDNRMLELQASGHLGKSVRYQWRMKMVNVFQLTAAEVAASDMYEEERWEFLKRPEFRLATMNSRDREKMLDAMVEELGIRGGWFWKSDDGVTDGPFET